MKVFPSLDSAPTPLFPQWFQPLARLGRPCGLAVALLATVSAEPAPPAAALDVSALRNPVWVSSDNLRDPSVLKVKDGYQLFYSRLAGGQGGWADPRNWTIGAAFTKDFEHFEGLHDVSPPGCASPGDVVFWHGRWVLPYQFYPARPVKLCFSESKDLSQWSAPKAFLEEALELPWNEQKRVIDPTFVVDGDTLHCFFVGSKGNVGGKGHANLMGHAITRDPGLSKWEILTPDAPLIGISERAPDGVENTMIVKTGDHWTMIYSEGLANQHLALASSRDLLKWTLDGPIELPRQQWMKTKFGAPFVWRDGTGWLMILMGQNANSRTTFGLLTSPDARQWKLLPERHDP